ncbi:MAG: hypothetical protein WAN75_43865, partial [Xanthobacteraceae bacterium]
MFGFLQQWRAQQQSTRAGTPVRRPAARKLTKFRVLSDPADIARESFSETVREPVHPEGARRSIVRLPPAMESAAAVHAGRNARPET